MKFGLIGEKLEHSYSELIHKKLDAYTYELRPVERKALDEFLKSRNFLGLNVTIPYKQAVIPYCDRLTPLAKKLNSVNTLFFDSKGRLTGANTDYHGFIKAVSDANLDFKDKKILILGRGGAAATFSAAVSDCGAAEVVFATRTLPKECKDAQIIINATPVGMYPNNLETLIDLKDFPKCRGVFDAIYNPYYTKLLLQAKDLGMPYANGFSMLVSQATKAAEFFTNKSGFCERDSEITAFLKSRLMNIILIGMPGCGKTTAGKELSKLTGRKFIDTDQEIEKSEFSSIPELFQNYGEKYFRDCESKIAEKAGKKSGLIIAGGGGIILREKNMDALRQNGIIVFINRNTQDLSTEGRPLSKNLSALQEMRKKRMPLYIKYSDTCINSSDTPAETAYSILDSFMHAI